MLMMMIVIQLPDILPSLLSLRSCIGNETPQSVSTSGSGIGIAEKNIMGFRVGGEK
jgi:hypothetical protein